MVKKMMRGKKNCINDDNRHERKEKGYEDEEGSRMYLNKFDRWVINHDKEGESPLSSNLNVAHQRLCGDE